MPLSKPSSAIKAEYDAVVIGSGYGGSVAAARLSEKGRSVCVLEKGKEYRKGDFPESMKEFAGSIWTNQDIPFQKKFGLFEFRHYKDLDILSGCGLGGGSLINAGVLEKPSAEVLSSEEWPQEIRRSPESLNPYYELAYRMLEAQYYPENLEGYALLKKYSAFRNAAEEESIDCRKASLTVNFMKSEKNSYGAEQEPCTGCGNCFSGCNYNAKNSLDKNYLYLAEKKGAEIFTGFYVSHIKYIENIKKYAIFCQETDSSSDSPFIVILASETVISAGAVGSTEILLRSKEAGGLKISDSAGSFFSGNGGFIAGGINADFDINQIGLKKGQAADRRIRKQDRRFRPEKGKDRRLHPANPKVFREQVGPTITTLLDRRQSAERTGFGHVIEDSAIPGVMASAMPFYWYAAVISRILRGEISLEKLREIIDKNSILQNNEILRRAVIFLGVSHDGSLGKLFLKPKQDGKIQDADLLWHNYIGQQNIYNLRKDMSLLMEKMNGIFLDYAEVGSGRPLSVHPLGGCRMSDSSSSGVVNDRCQVYRTDSSKAVYEGLYVLDGGIIPRSLGINPMWTITALSERAMSFIEDRNIQMQKNQNANEASEHGHGIRFIEKFKGFWSNEADENYEYNYKKGERSGLGRQIEIQIEVKIPDLKTFTETGYVNRISGEMDAPALSIENRLLLTEGSHFQFKNDPDSSFVRYFIYELIFLSDEGRKFLLKGRKELQTRNFMNVWSETTRMHFDIFELHDGDREKFQGKGTAVISLESFLRNNIGTMQSLNTDSFPESMNTVGSFLLNFLKNLFKVYSIRSPFRSRGEMLPAKLYSRTKNFADKEEILLKTEDGLLLSLQHWKGKTESSLGSVLLLHGLTSSSEMFSMPEHLSLTEWLIEQGYEVWLYDFRMSGKLPYNQIQHNYSFDHTAAYDIPAAVRLIRNRTGEKQKLHVVCHCLGSVSFFHSLIGGCISGVDSVISNSVSIFASLPFTALLKLELLINSRFLEDIVRLPIISPQALKESDWLQSIISYGNSFFHHECDSAVCHMLSFMWGTESSALFEHKNMLDVTHSRLEELFGPVSMNYYRHVIKIARRGSLISYYEKDERFRSLNYDFAKAVAKNRVPVLFVTGRENKVFRDSNIKAYHFMNSANQGIHSLKIFPGYGHQDVFMGRNSDKDIFPEFLRFWNSIRQR